MAGFLLAILPNDLRIVGGNENLAGIPQLFLLLFTFGIPFFVLPFGVKTLLPRHDQP